MNVVVTGGGTIAPIDDVRLIANVSSGSFSARLSEAWLARGATVWHVHAPSAVLPIVRQARLDLDAPDRAAEFGRLERLAEEWRSVRARLRLVPLAEGTVADYAATLERTLRDRPVDVVMLAMAVSDFEPAAHSGKLDSDVDELVIRGRRAPKVIQSVRDWAPGAYLVGFKLLSRSSPAALIRAAESACRTNRADATIANDLQTLRAGSHTVHLVRPGHPAETLEPGADLADRVVARLADWASVRPR